MTAISPDKLIENILQVPAEDRITELKRLGKDFNISKALESIVAMANTDGGLLILGIDDPQKTKLKGIDRVLGIEESHEKYDELNREIQRISPPISHIWPPSRYIKGISPFSKMG